MKSFLSFKDPGLDVRVALDAYLLLTSSKTFIDVFAARKILQIYRFDPHRPTDEERQGLEIISAKATCMTFFRPFLEFASG